jgi:hypothetical protein
LKNWLTGLQGNLRQLKYPRDFRIGPPVWPQDTREALDEIVRLIQSLSQTAGESSQPQDMERFVAEVGTGIWRARKKLAELGMKETSKELRFAVYAVESTWDVLKEDGVEIQDHTGEFITGGEALKILSFETSAEVLREQVTETIKPTIYYKNRMVQPGEVVVGKPLTYQ